MLLVDTKEYYRTVFDKLQKGFQFNHYVLAYGNDLRLRELAQGRTPRLETALPLTVEPISNLWDLTSNWGLEVFIPVVGHNSCAVLSSLDYEIYLDNPNRLYADQGSQSHYFNHYIGPVTDFVAGKLEEYKIPYAVDLTPSGGHFLFWVREGTEEWRQLVAVGSLEDDLKKSYDYFDSGDLKRNPKLKLEAGYVYSALGRLWEYVSRLAVRDVRVGEKELPLTLSDHENKSVNLDITAYGDPAYMRIMRAPFSVHKKRVRYVSGADPLTDVMLWYYDGESKIGEKDFNHLISCMWDLEKASKHAEHFSGYIPCANANLVKLIDEYKNSKLYAFHHDFDQTPDLGRQEAFLRAREDSQLNDKTKSMLEHPNPRTKDPKALVKFIADLTERGWHPKHIGNLIADLYEQPQHHWLDNWLKYPSRTRGNFWARVYSGSI